MTGTPVIDTVDPQVDPAVAKTVGALDGAGVPVLDGVTDPHNLGACLRTADAAGALRDVGTGNPDPHLIPDLAPALASVADRGPVLYGEPTIDRDLGSWALDWMAPDVPVPAEEVRLTLTSGAVDAVLIARVERQCQFLTGQFSRRNSQEVEADQ